MMHKGMHGGSNWISGALAIAIAFNSLQFVVILKEVITIRIHPTRFHPYFSSLLCIEGETWLDETDRKRNEIVKTRNEIVKS